jgi:glutathione synthase/RimK-type ligase-like ATP-grasp enzyme
MTIASRPARLLVVVGCDSGGKTTSTGRIRVAGNSDFIRFVRDNAPFEQMNLGIQLKAAKQAFKVRGPADLSGFECVLNLVTDPDLNPRTLETLGKMLRGYRGRVINRPEAVLRTTRDKVAKRLAGIPGLHVPKVLRLRGGKPDAALLAAERAGLAFPAILRRAGTHTGDIVGRMANPEELRAALTEPGDHILTEFVDFRSADGLYRKYRVFVFGEHLIVRHMIAADNWDIHSRDRLRFMVEHPALLEEEARLLHRPEGTFPRTVHAVLHAIRERMGLDYFGVDFGVRDGEVVLFEANATMNFFPFMTDPRFAYLERSFAPAQEAVRNLIGQW